MNVRSIDLNLLVLFDALMAEGNLTRAAGRVGLSQPAMSNALARLRGQVGDPLFVRAPRGVRPTERARRLAGPIRRALADLDAALSPEVFDPATTHRTFTIMMNDIHELVLGPRLSERVAREAPGVDLRLMQGPTTLPEVALSSGEVDLVLSPLDDETRRGCHAALYPLGFSSLVRRDHPGVGRRLTMRRFLELEHVLVAPRGRPGGAIDEKLAERGLRRRVARMVAHFVSAAVVVARSDYVVTVPSILAESMAAILPLRVLAPPIEIPAVVIAQFWSKRVDADAGHQWMRGLLSEAAREATGRARK